MKNVEIPKFWSQNLRHMCEGEGGKFLPLHFVKDKAIAANLLILRSRNSLSLVSGRFLSSSLDLSPEHTFYETKYRPGPLSLSLGSLYL